MSRDQEQQMMKQTMAQAMANPRPAQEALDEVERELLVRARCYPRWIEDGRLNRSDAKDRLERLATALAMLRSAPQQ